MKYNVYWRKTMAIKPPKRRPKAPEQKTFKAVAWTGANEGKKIMAYGGSGIGKTTLVSLLPGRTCFIGVDDGGRLIKNPITGEDLMHVEGIETFADVRAVLQQPTIFSDFDNIAIDNVSELERWALPYMFQTVPKSSEGQPVKNIEDYGYHKGYRRWYDIMRLILSDCDPIVRSGKNIILVAQANIAKSVQAGTEDFVKEAPALHHDKNVSTMNMYVEWCDHVFRIANCNITVSKKNKAGGDMSRAVYVHPEPHFVAKSRTISAEWDVVSFENIQDDSIWKLVFPEKYE